MHKELRQKLCINVRAKGPRLGPPAGRLPYSFSRYGRNPEERDPNLVSWDELIDAGWEAEQEDKCSVEGDTRIVDQIQSKLEYAEIRKLMETENPIIPVIFEMKELDGLSASEISARTGVTKRNVYYYLDRAKEIGKSYRE